LIAALVLSVSYRKDIEIPASLAGRHVTVDGVKLRVYQQGNGPDVLFLHGSIGNLEDFETVMPALAKQFRVTSIDRIGHGYSEMAPDKANIASNTAYTEKLIQVLKLNDVIVVGHSYGGSIALKMALDKTPGTRGYVLIAPAAYPFTSTRLIEHVLATPSIGKGLLVMLRPFIAEPMLKNALLYSLKPNVKDVDPTFMEFRLKLWNNTGILYTRVQQTSDVIAELAQMSTQYQNIQQPVTILLGDSEPHRDIAADCHRLVKAIPDSKLTMVKGSGHYIQYKDPQTVIDAIVAMSNK
jgi:pimeloyl-ACP methyl ester carboxylesterase